MPPRGLDVVGAPDLRHLRDDKIDTSAADGLTSDAEMAHYGIIRKPVDYFEYGGYRYTSLGDAVAQAKRQRAGRNEG